MKKSIKQLFQTVALITFIFSYSTNYAQCNVVADFSYSITCNNVVFTDQSTCNSGCSFIEWDWDFGDGLTSYMQNPVHIYNNTATYQVTLTVRADSMGYICSNTIIKLIEVTSLPDISFTWSPEPTPLGDITSFFGNSTSTITNWDWDFGDGNNSNGQNADHIFMECGIYTVDLSVTDNNGCQNSITHNVTISNLPALDFTWDISCANQPTQFSVLNPPTDINAVTSWYWDFGDGSTSNAQDPIHTYAQTGNYNVDLTITDTLGLSNSLTKSLTTNEIPISSFTFSGNTCSNNKILFTDLSTIGTGYINQWDWNFGDGSTLTVVYPNNPDVTHEYATSSTFTVSLSLTSSNSCSNTSSQDITINPSPIADFTYDITCYNQPVTFTDISTNNGGGDIVTWEWDFGDGSISNLQNPAHLFSSTGDYTTRLIVTNTTGCTDTTQNIINIYEPPVDFTYTNTCYGSIVVFEVDESVTNISEVAAFSWSFGDGGTSTLQNPTHLYNSAGIYTVTLSITTIDNCIGNVTHDIEIYALPDVGITCPSYSPNIGAPYQFYGNSSDSIVNWVWNFDDENSSTLQNPIHIFNAYQSYNVKLDVFDTHNCQNIDSILVTVLPPPVFPESNAIWNTIGENIYTFETWRLRFGLIGDTTISLSKDTSYIYSKVYNLYDSTLYIEKSTYFGAIRTSDDQKVFLKLPELPETILYDFSANIGDTIRFTVGGFASNNILFFEQESHYKVVTIIDSMLLLDNQYHKLIALEGDMLNDMWVEGMGSIEWVGLFNPIITDITLGGNNYHPACYKENNFPLFINNSECGLCFCYLLTHFDEINNIDNNLKVYPNPAKNAVTIEVTNYNLGKYEFIILNTLGKKVYSSISTDEGHVNTSNLPDGIYFVILTSNQETVAIEKLIISR